MGDSIGMALSICPKKKKKIFNWPHSPLRLEKNIMKRWVFPLPPSAQVYKALKFPLVGHCKVNTGVLVLVAILQSIYSIRSIE